MVVGSIPCAPVLRSFTTGGRVVQYSFSFFLRHDLPLWFANIADGQQRRESNVYQRSLLPEQPSLPRG